MNTVFQNLDKNRVPHGILTDFGLDYVDLSSYDGSLSADNYTSRATVHESFYDLISSRIRQVNTGFMQPQDFEKLWQNQRTEGLITLGGLYFKYAKFKDDARTSGKIRVTNNKLYDVFTNGVWQNPYEEQSTFILAPSINTYKGLNLQVKLPQDVFLSNYPSQIQSIAVDFGDGLGYRTIGYNQTLNVTYTQVNTYVWKYKLNLPNGQTLYSHSKVLIEEGLRTKPYNHGGGAKQKNGLEDYETVSVTATEAYYGKFGKATLYIRDAGTAGITNPLIVAEGFDTGVVLNPEQEAGDNTIEDFIESYEFLRSRSILLQNELNSYDIIYVDWDNGVDFIQRNAFALEEAIRWVNDNKTGTTPNTIIGQSMGGLVARYALANIEQNGDFNHDTDLYISHDAPHLGANTPIGMQHMYRHVNNMYQSAPIPLLLGEVLIPLAYDASGIYEDTVNAYGGNVTTDLGQFVTPNQYLSVSDFPASRQMLYNWVNTDYNIRNVIHNAWQSELSAMGYPQGYPNAPIRNIAIANGSECGIDYTEGSLIRYEKTAADKTVLNSIIGLTDIGVGLALFGTWQGAVLVSLGILPGNSKYDIIFNASSMATLNADKQIYYGRITYKKKILWFIPISINLTREDKDQPNGVLPYDAYGGGAYTIANYLGDLFEQLPTIQNNGTFGRYGFIPTASALDAGKGIVNLNDTDYRRTYVGGNPPPVPKDSPFQNFTTHFDQLNPANNNSEHISFNRRNGDWLTAELRGTNIETTNCSFACDAANVSITGDNQLCQNDVYTLINAPSPITWSINDPNGLVTSVINNNSITLTKNNTTASGSITLSATYGNQDCGFYTRTEDIWVGKPKAYTTNPDPTICTNVFEQPTLYSLPVSPGADTYQLTSNSPNLYVDAFATPGLPINMMTAQAGNYTITLTTSNSCGSKQATIYVTAENCGGDFGSFRVMQNPVESESLIVIETDEGELNNTINNFAQENNNEQGNINGNGNEDKVTLELYDFSGNLLKTKKVKRNHLDKKYLINISQYDNGNYFIRILYKEIDEVYQVIFDK